MRIIIIICALGAIGIFCISTTSGTIIQIPEDYATIQLGIEAAVDGDTVLVFEGSYFEQINFKGKGILLTSNYLYNPDSAVIAGTIIEGANFVHPDTESVVLFVSNEDSNSVLQGFTITGGGGTGDYDVFGGGIYIYSSSPIIRNNIIRNNSIYPRDMGATFGGGIYANEAHGLRLLGNIITLNGTDGWRGSFGAGLKIRGAGMIIRDNVISFNIASGSAPPPHGGGGWVGGLFCSSIGVTISGNRIFGNKTSGAFPEPNVGLHYNGSNGKIENNIIYENQTINAFYFWSEEGIGAVIAGDSNEIIGNQFWGHQHGAGDFYSLPAIEIKGDYNLVVENLISESEDFISGIWVVGSFNILERNIIWDCGVNGISIISENNIENLLLNNTIHASVKNGIFILEPAIDLMIVNNIISSSGEYGIYDSAGVEPLILYNDFYNNSSGDFYNCSPSIGNIYEDPLFVEPDSGDFNLVAGSPCIDAGFPGSPLDPDGTRADIGALYFAQMTEINDGDESTTPDKYRMLTNYPNPFNSVTTIKYRILGDSGSSEQYVRLEIFNLAGQKIETLINEAQTPGEYFVVWDASDLPSGLYFCKLNISGRSIVHKMVLLK